MVKITVVEAGSRAEKAGVKYVQVEQDNACEFPDPFGQMEISYGTLRPLIK